jgi:hypothetical protein
MVEEMEQELGKPIFDSIVVTLWKALDMSGIRRTIPGWGTLLEASAALPNVGGQSEPGETAIEPGSFGAPAFSVSVVFGQQVL